MKGWVDTTVLEVYSYVGLRFLMFYCEGLMVDGTVAVHIRCSPRMTRDRFDALTTALHFADNEAEHDTEDQLWKLRPVLDVLDSMCRSVFVPNQERDCVGLQGQAS